MQYSGSSFSAQLLSVFRSILRRNGREDLPLGPFPAHGYLNTHYVDAVERRMFKVLGDGEAVITKWMITIKDEPRFAFTIGLVFIVSLTLLVVGQ